MACEEPERPVRRLKSSPLCGAFRKATIAEENGMLWGSRRASGLTLVAGLLVLGPAALAQGSRAWVDPPGDLPAEPVSRPDPAARPGSDRAAVADREARRPGPAEPGRDSPVAASAMRAPGPADATATGRIAPPPPAVTYQLTPRETAARDLAFRYLDLWSAPNPVTLAAAASFYGPSVLFHGQVRAFGSVLAEKRRFAQRWPDRAYRYRRETTQVACDSGGVRCTVWSLFDFSALNPDQGRRSRGIGEHELIVSFLSHKPVIVSETSRVLRRGWFETGESW
jgi:hypothetical protein